MMTRNEQHNETAQFYKDSKKPVHIKLIDGKFLNGLIISVGDNRLVLQEEKFGEMLIFFERIATDIVPREEKR